jgi:transcriptional regulator with PAS, ATPase and Fis domain
MAEIEIGDRWCASLGKREKQTQALEQSHRHRAAKRSNAYFEEVVTGVEHNVLHNVSREMHGNSQNCFRVEASSKVSQSVSESVSKCLKVSQSVSKCLKVSQSVPESVSKCLKVSQSVSKCLKVSQKVSQSVSKCLKVSQSASKCLKVSHEVAESVRERRRKCREVSHCVGGCRTMLCNAAGAQNTVSCSLKFLQRSLQGPIRTFRDLACLFLARPSL